VVDAGTRAGRNFAPERTEAEANVFDAVTKHVHALQSGRKLFVAFNCSGCHGGHAGGGMGPSLRDEDWIHGNTAGDIFNSISQGRAHGMPSWGTMLPPQYIWQLVGYIQSMRTPQEPDPPR